MSINVRWENDNQTAILFVFNGQWTWDDFYQAASQSNTLMDSVDYPVNLLIDLANSPSLPKNFLFEMRNVGANGHPNTGMIVVIGANFFITSMAKMFRKIYQTQGGKFAMTNTLKEARDLLQSTP